MCSRCSGDAGMCSHRSNFSGVPRQFAMESGWNYTSLSSGNFMATSGNATEGPQALLRRYLGRRAWPFFADPRMERRAVVLIVRVIGALGEEQLDEAADGYEGGNRGRGRGRGRGAVQTAAEPAPAPAASAPRYCPGRRAALRPCRAPLAALPLEAAGEAQLLAQPFGSVAARMQAAEDAATDRASALGQRGCHRMMSISDTHS